MTKEQQFRSECKVVSMRHTYPGYTGDVKWIIVTNLTETQINEKYPEEINWYTPFVVITKEMYEPFVEWDKNRLKFYYRARNCADAFCYEDNLFEVFHPEMVVDPFRDSGSDYLESGLSQLSEVQRRRIIKRFFDDMSVYEIAQEEKTTTQAITKSIRLAIKNLREILCKGCF